MAQAGELKSVRPSFPGERARRRKEKASTTAFSDSVEVAPTPCFSSFIFTPVDNFNGPQEHYRNKA